MRAFASTVVLALCAAQCSPRAVSPGKAGGRERPVVRIEAPPGEAELAKSEVVAQVGHNLDVWAIAWSPTGKRIATGGFEHSIKIWNDQGRLLATFSGHREAITDLAFSRDGDVLASAARDGTVRVWDLHHAGKHRILEHAGDHFALSPSGQAVATVGYDLVVRIWDVKSAKIARTFDAPGGRQLRAVAWSADGSRIAAASLDGQLYVWDADSGKVEGRAAGAGGALTSVAFSPDGRTIAGAGQNLTLTDTTSFAVRTLSHPDTDPTKVAFSPDGKLVATNGTTGKVHLWDSETGKYKRTLAHPGYIEALAWSPSGALAVGGKVPLRTSDGSLSELPVARVWDVTTGTQILHFEGQARPVGVAELSPNGELLLTADPEAALWELKTGARKRVLDPAGAISARFSPDGSLIALASRKAIRVLEIQSGRELATIPGSELEPLWSPDGKWLALRSFESVQVWQTEKRRARRLSSSQKGAYDVAFTNDSREIAIAIHDGIDIYSLETGSVSRKISLTGHAASWSNPEQLSISPNGKLAATLNGKGMTLWDAAGGFLDLVSDRTRFATPAWSPDGRTLAYSAGNDLRLWGAPGTYRGHDAVIRTIAWSPDGKSFASSSDDSSVRVWKTGQAHATRTFATHSGRVWTVAWHPSGQALLAVGNEAQFHDLRTGRTLGMIALPGATGAAWYTDSGQYAGDESAARALLLRPSDDLLDPALDGQGAALERRPDLLSKVLFDSSAD